MTDVKLILTFAFSGDAPNRAELATLLLDAISAEVGRNTALDTLTDATVTDEAWNERFARDFDD